MDKRFIEACEREALHLSGAIQPHGALLVIDGQRRVAHHSDNLASYLTTADELAIDAEVTGDLLALVEQLPAVAGARLQFEAALPGREGLLDAVLTCSVPGEVVVELVPNRLAGDAARAWNIAVALPAHEEGLRQQQEALLEKIFAWSGYRRVMYYRFRDDGDGEVLAEIRQEGVVGSYLGLRFPASDIPQVARSLYLLNPWRMIPDAAAPPVALRGRSGTPDLSRADLRSVSPVHALYLANMGVAASLSFPIAVGGQLWGLIACHHDQPRQVSLDRLSAIALEVRAHALGLSSYFAQRRIQLIDGLQRRFDAVRSFLRDSGDIVAAWPRLAPWLAEEFAVDGVHLCFADGQLAWGDGFEPEALAVADAWFCGSAQELVWHGESLSRQFPDYPLSRVAGMLAIKARLGERGLMRLYLCRHEHIHDVAWGGNPDKPVEYHDGVFGIAPRRSFEKWVEKRLGQCRPWSNETRLLGLRLRELLLQLGRQS